jgi:hypothetical protein
MALSYPCGNVPREKIESNSLWVMVFYSINVATRRNSNHWEKTNFLSHSLTYRLREKIFVKKNHRDTSSENQWLVEEFAFCLLQNSIVLKLWKAGNNLINKNKDEKARKCFPSLINLFLLLHPESSLKTLPNLRHTSSNSQSCLLASLCPLPSLFRAKMSTWFHLCFFFPPPSIPTAMT